MKTVLKSLLALVVLLVVAAGGVYGWAFTKDRSLLARHIATHTAAFPIPFPLTDAEVAALQDSAKAARQPALTDEQLATVAHDRAVARGKHLVDSRYVCTECHGKDFGGGVMIDAAPIGHIMGPNLTLGEGGVTKGFTPADWDRIVRHGVKPDGSPAVMPSEDFQRMSDEELSDVVAYIRTMPPVNKTIPAPTLGPVGRVLVATGKIPLAADLILDHDAVHRVRPPVAEASVEFGQHLAGVCQGCHRADFTGGPVPGGDPSWPPAANLTPVAGGIQGWTYQDFLKAVTEGKKPDGTELRVPMADVVPYLRQMTDVELQALWMYLETVPAKATAQ